MEKKILTVTKVEGGYFTTMEEAGKKYPKFEIIFHDDAEGRAELLGRLSSFLGIKEPRP